MTAYIRKVTGRVKSESLAKVKSSLLSLSMCQMCKGFKQ